MKHRTRNAGGVAVANSDGHVIGLDLGATAVRAAVLAPQTVRGRATVQADGMGAIPLPTGAIINGVVHDVAAVTEALRQLWSDYKLSGRRVVLGATSQQVMVREFSVPDMAPDQLRKVLPLQAQEVIALPLDQAVLDFSPLGPPNERDGMVAGLLTGMPRDPIVRAVHAVEKAKLRVVRVDLSPFGLLRALGTPGPAIEALIDIGANLTTIVVHVNGIAKVVRVVQHGGAAWTAHLADQTDLPLDEAEATKRTIGLVGTSLASRLLRESIKPMANEIRSSINFFASQNRVTVERITITGGSSALPGLDDYLVEQLGAPVGRIMLDRNIEALGKRVAATNPAGTSAVAIGLAMGAAA